MKKPAYTSRYQGVCTSSNSNSKMSFEKFEKCSRLDFEDDLWLYLILSVSRGWSPKFTFNIKQI